MTVINGVCCDCFLAPSGAAASPGRGKPHLPVLEHPHYTRQPAFAAWKCPRCCAAGGPTRRCPLAAPTAAATHPSAQAPIFLCPLAGPEHALTGQPDLRSKPGSRGLGTGRIANGLSGDCSWRIGKRIRHPSPGAVGP